jgi:hypothetical protein
MGMIRGTISVVEAGGETENSPETTAPAPSDYEAPAYLPGGCCGVY